MCPYVHNQKWPQTVVILSNQRRATILRSGARLCRSENDAGTAPLHADRLLNSGEDRELEPMFSYVVMWRNLKLHSKFPDVFFLPLWETEIRGSCG